jgi:hypothetical protein
MAWLHEHQVFSVEREAKKGEIYYEKYEVSRKRNSYGTRA